MSKTARLALADGSVFHGLAFGATDGSTTAAGEVVFNTAMVGYQEALTDPSYAGQILTMTAPQIGNTGANGEDLESETVHPTAFVVRELARRHSNFRATESLDEFLRARGTLGIERVDTRALTHRLRSAGVMPGVVSDDESLTDEELIEIAKSLPGMAGRDLVSGLSRNADAEPDWASGLHGWTGVGSISEGVRADATVLAVDCGAKSNILRHLTERGCRVRLVASDISAEEVLAAIGAGEASGLFISNGPGDPEAVEQTVAMLREVIERAPRQFPIFGICLGHQLIARAIGATTFKLPFGHRGANHPVLEHGTGRVSITSQNHGFAVDPDSLAGTSASVTHTHLNDGTVAGLGFSDRPVFSVQHHPEASPGPHDAQVLFDRFTAGVSVFASSAVGN